MKLVNNLGTPFYLRNFGLNSGATPSSSQIRVQANSAGGLSFLSYAADNAAIGFDADFGLVTGGTGWIARDTSALLLYKSLATFQIRGKTGLTVGSEFSPNALLSLDIATGTLFPGQSAASCGALANRWSTIYGVDLNLSGNILFTGTSTLDATTYSLSHKVYATSGGGVTRSQFGHFDLDGGVPFPTAQAAPQVKAGSAHLYLGSQGTAASSIRFHTSSGSALAKCWEMNSSGHFVPGTNNTYDIGSTSARVRALYLNGPLVAGNAALAKTATDGFLYVPSISLQPTETPSGTPTSYGDTVPIVYDKQHNKLWAYNGTWKHVDFS